MVLCVRVVFLRQMNLLCLYFELADQESVSNKKLSKYCIDNIILQNYLLRQCYTSATCFPPGGNWVSLYLPGMYCGAAA